MLAFSVDMRSLFPSFLFLTLFVSLYLKYFSCSGYIAEACFLRNMQSDNLCLLIGVFRSFTVNVIIDIVRLIHLAICFYLSHLYFFLFFFFCLLC